MTEHAPVEVATDERGVCTVTLNRPEVRNAFDARLIGALHDTFVALSEDDSRVVVIAGAGPVFCAGADLNWMKGMRGWTQEENAADSSRFEAMLRVVDGCPKPVVARVHGHALGGGSGLVACADVAIAARGALFGFTEVRLGIAPAVISPYVVPRIGVSAARHLFLTGERFDADEAARIGLVRRAVAADELDAAVAAVVSDLLAGAPGGQAAIKALLRDVVAAGSPEEAAQHTVPTIARLRVSDEGQEGMAAFFEQRAPTWRR